MCCSLYTSHATIVIIIIVIIAPTGCSYCCCGDGNEDDDDMDYCCMQGEEGKENEKYLSQFARRIVMYPYICVCVCVHCAVIYTTKYLFNSGAE